MHGPGRAISRFRRVWPANSLWWCSGLGLAGNPGCVKSQLTQHVEGEGSPASAESEPQRGLFGPF
eukprot:7104785-Alexandrium_andersonii.AAC.1